MVAVDGELERARPNCTAIAVPSATFSSRPGGDQVVLADVDALGRQHVTDGAAEGAHLCGRAVEGQGDTSLLSAA